MSKKEVDVVLFGVGHDEDIKRAYPDLSKVEEFKDLDSRKVKFCWLIGNRTSPIFGMERQERIKKALEIVWGKEYQKNPLIKNLFDDDDDTRLSDNILKAVYKMNTFNPTYRLKAKLMAEYIFETLNGLIVLDKNELKMMEIDEKKKYADLIIKVSSELLGMVEKIESSYGIKTINRKTKNEAVVSINDLM